MVAIDERLAVNFDRRRAWLDGRHLKLSPTESRLLQALYEQRGRVVSPGGLIVRAWSPDAEPSLRTLWVHIRRLRNKIEPDPNFPRYVVTVPGRGYFLPSAVSTAEEAERESSCDANRIRQVWSNLNCSDLVAQFLYIDPVLLCSRYKCQYSILMCANFCTTFRIVHSYLFIHLDSRITICKQDSTKPHSPGVAAYQTGMFGLSYWRRLYSSVRSDGVQ